MSVVIALVTTLGFDALINLILGNPVGISTIASLNSVTISVMFVLGLGLNLIASIIPARIAARKDPVVALRTE